MTCFCFCSAERRYGRRRSVRQYEAGEIMTSSVEVEAAIPRTLEEGEEKTGTEEENSEQQTKTEKKDKTDQRDQHCKLTHSVTHSCINTILLAFVVS